MIVYDLDWAMDDADWEVFQKEAKEFGVKIRYEDPKPGREFITFSADGPKEALRWFLLLYYQQLKPDDITQTDCDEIEEVFFKGRE